jgi:class 3 adenylate cyclase
MAEIEHPHLAVMFTDIKGYSRIMSEDEPAALKMLGEHNQIMDSVIEAHGGRLVKNLGDSYMVIFDQADSAVKCGLHALTKISARNRKSDVPVEIRLGVHEGSMLERGGDFFGDNVNIAARLEQLAKPMTIAVSEQILKEVATRVRCEARFVGAQALKNIRYPVSVYQLTPSELWKLYLSADGPVADEGHEDLLGEITDGGAAWLEVEQLTRQGDLDAAASLADAALSKFGGTYAEYAHLAAIHLLARNATEAQSVLKMGDMLGQKSDDDAGLAWIQTLAGSSINALKGDAAERDKLIADAQDYVSGHDQELSMRLLLERVKAQLTGHLGGLTALAQQHADTALVLRGYAEALKDEGREADAYSMLERTIDVAPAVAHHRLRRAEWMIDGGDLESVLAESEELSKRFPDDPRVYQWSARMRLLNLDPHGAQWILEQRKDSAAARGLDTAHWHICSLMQQGRFEPAVEQARMEMRSAIRQNQQRAARRCLQLAVAGMYLEHWSGVLEILEEYRRFDSDWYFPQAAVIAAKFQRDLLSWDRAIDQLNDLAGREGAQQYPHPSGLTAVMLLYVVPDAEHWDQLRNLEFLKAHGGWIVEQRDFEAAALEARAAVRFGRVDTWHLQLAPVLTHLSSRQDPRMPSLLALAGLIRTKLNDFTAAKPDLEQARRFWHQADWPVWEIQEAYTALAAGEASTNPPS